MTEQTTSGTATAVAPEAARSNLPLAATGLALGVLMSVLDQTVVAIALPHITADLGGADQASWIMAVYVLASTASGTLYGRLSDRFGRRGVFLFAVTLFTVASLLCAVATGMGQLIAYRVLQGIGAGALFVVPTIALSELVRPDLRSRVQGYVGALFATASLAGPLVGGLLTDAATWRWIFYVNLPLGMLALGFVAAGLRLPRHPTSSGRVDVAGSGLLVGAVITMILACEWGGRHHPWGSPVIVSLLAGSALLFAAFVWWEGRTADPLLPLHLFRHPTVRTALPAAFVLGAMVYGSIVFVPTYLQHAFGYSATMSGLALTPYLAAFVLASAVGGVLAGTASRAKAVLVTGSVVAGLAFGLLSNLDGDSGYGRAALALVVLGSGVGLVMQLLVTVAQNAVRGTDLAATSAAVLSVRGLGMTVGVALFGSLLTRAIGDADPTPALLADAIPEVMLWGAPLAGLLAFLIVILPVHTPDRQA